MSPRQFILIKEFDVKDSIFFIFLKNNKCIFSVGQKQKIHQFEKLVEP